MQSETENWILDEVDCTTGRVAGHVDGRNIQETWNVANDKARIIQVSTWKFLLKFQENVNELLNPE